ncbi:MAG TPA: tetratricopeptide repeat protein [Deferrisomatales bacterium]|nr:tetratricopeptide repeat protein [Deferrisomatales bacterium]
MRLSWLTALAILGLVLASAPSISATSPLVGKAAPGFALKDRQGQLYALQPARDKPLLVLWFFAADSRPSQEGFLTLDRLAKRFPAGALSVWGITESTAEEVAAFVDKAGLTYPVLLDDGAVSEKYGAAVVLPTACVLGPDLTVLDHFVGGGEATEGMLVRLAERKLQQRETAVAKALGDAVVKQNPQNVAARGVQGQTALAERDLAGAEAVFRELAKQPGEGEVVGKVGLAAVHVARGEPDKALVLAEEVEKKAPQRSSVQVVKGDALLARGDAGAAGVAYRAAAAAGSSDPAPAARASNQLGRLLARSGEYAQAQELYAKAEALDPFDVEVTTNKGVAYEKQGRWAEALEAYRQAAAAGGGDPFAAALARRAQEMLDLQRDAERSRRVDQLVKDLSARFRGGAKIPAAVADDWTTGPLVLTFVDFTEKGGMAEREGFSTVLLTLLSEQLAASGRVRVVERTLMAHLLEELNLGSSELADPNTALRLGRLLAARIMGTGTLLHGPQGSVLSLRLIDTETSRIPQVATRTLAAEALLEDEVFALTRGILRTVIAEYPLRGFVVRMDGDRALLNIGADHGVVLGTEFDILEESEPVEYKGKTLKGAPRSVAHLRVVSVEPGLCHAQVLEKERSLRQDDRVQERIVEVAAK